MVRGIGRIAVFGLVAGALALVGGCARDFDALFAGGPDGSVEADGAADGGAGVCAPEPSACPTSATCSASNCTYDCPCGCACSKVQCSGGGAKTCTAGCGASASCDIDCRTDDCDLSAHGAAAAKLACSEDADDCKLTCDAGSTCEMLCNADDKCSASCSADSQCVLRCGDKPSSCNLDCPGGKRTQCGTIGGNQVFTCNRECPPK